MALRSFVFLDTDVVDEYLSGLEGAVVEGPIDQTETEKKGKSGGIGYRGVGLTASGEKSFETTQRLSLTGSAKFQRLYTLLDERGEIQYLEGFDEAIWDQLKRGEALEVQATIRVPDLFKVAEVTEQASDLLDLMVAIGQDPLTDPSVQTGLEGMRAFGKLVEKKHVPLLFEATQAPRYRFVASLPRQFLRVQPSDLQGEATVFGIIQRKVPRGERVESFNLLPDLD